MSQVTLEALAERVGKLEQVINRLLKEENHEQTAQAHQKKEPEPVVFKDWRKAIAYAKTLPPPDPEMEQQFQSILGELREADRRATLEEAEREEAERGGDL